MQQANTGIILNQSGQSLDLACPFHPPKCLDHSDDAHQYSLIHTPIRAGIDCFSIHLNVHGGLPWNVNWGDNRLALGFVEANWAKLKIQNQDIDKLEDGQWFRYSGSELSIDRTDKNGIHFNLILCSREATQQLLQLDHDNQHPSLNQFIHEDHPLAFNSGTMNATTRSTASTISQSKSSGLKNRLQLEANILIWFAETLSLTTQLANTANRTLNADDRDAIHHIAERIKADPGHEYSLTELCEIGNINEHKLKSAFKRIHGKTPFTYLREVRMDYAANLLKEDRLSVIQVANEVGYSNASHFARAFKDRHSLLPKAYQCLHRL